MSLELATPSHNPQDNYLAKYIYITLPPEVGIF